MTFNSLLEKSNDHPIIIYDGYCILCEKSIRRILELDEKRELRFVSSNHIENADYDTVILLMDGVEYYKSDVLVVLIDKLNIRSIKYVWLKYIPKPIRDFFYSLTSKNRYAIFGRKEICTIPSKERKEQFLIS